MCDSYQIGLRREFVCVCESIYKKRVCMCVYVKRKVREKEKRKDRAKESTLK
jgi:hypothetical protein